MRHDRTGLWRARAAALTALLAVTVAGPRDAAAQNAPQGSVFSLDQSFSAQGTWRVGLSQRFGGCVMTNSYRDQTTLWLGFTGDGNNVIAFTNPNWQSIAPDRDYEIEVVSDRGRSWRGTFRGFEQSRAERGVASFGLRREFLLDVARAGSISVRFDRQEIAQLSLRGSSSALEDALDCHRRFAFDPRSRGGGQQAAREQPPAQQRSQPPPQQQQQPPQQRGTSSGTGFFVSTRGHVLTNNHVIEGCTEIGVRRSGSELQRVNVVARDAINDLALLLTPLRDPRVPPMSTRLRLGESVYVYGFPLGGILSTTGNFTIGNVSALAGLRDDTRMVQHSAPTQPGNSGGPLIDERGNVVGVIVSKLNVLAVAQQTQGDIAQNVNFAIKSSVAAAFLQIHGINRDEPANAQELDATTIADVSREFTVQVICTRGG